MRRDGKTTRLIDSAIQELFNKGMVYIPNGEIARRLMSRDGRRGYTDEVFRSRIKYIDPDFRHNMAQDNFVKRFRDRLVFEHGEHAFISDGIVYKITGYEK